MTKFTGLAIVLAAVVGASLITPATSQAGWLFNRNRGNDCCYQCGDCCGYNYGCCNQCGGCQYNYGCCGQAVAAPATTATTTAAPCCSTTYYYPSGSYYSSGYYYPSYGGNTNGWYRVGNVIINGRRWGDAGYRYSHGDLIRW